MTMIDKFFYIIYNSYYKHGGFKNDHPTWTVGGLFVFLFFAIVLLLDLFLIRYSHNSISIFPIDNHRKHSLFELSPAKIAGLVGFAVVYFLFFFRKRYEDIYEKFKDDEFLNSTKAKRIAYTMLISICVAPFIIPLLLGRY
jgi:hypothetical protein